MSRFLIALLLSLLLHGLLSVGDTAWHWWQAEPDGPDAALSATQRKLASQALEEAAAVRGTRLPDGWLSVQLGHRQRSVHKAHHPHSQYGLQAISSIDAAAAPTPLPAEAGSAALVMPARLPDDEGTAGAARPELDTRFPRSVDIDYIAYGVIEAQHQWRASNGQYEIITRIKLDGRELRSSGEIDRFGLHPVRFSDWRAGQSQPFAQAEFNWQTREARLGESGKQYEVALSDGAQDMFSAAYQFALQGSKLPSFTMQVLSGRNSYLVPFALAGETVLSLSSQKISTLVLAGSFERRRFEFYLAPQWNNLPVRIRMVDGERSIDLRASQIRIEGKLVLSRPAPAQRDR